MPLTLRGSILNPQPNGRVEFWPDGVLIADDHGILTFAGPWTAYAAAGGQEITNQTTHTPGLIIPAFLDNHIHIPQHPIRGRFSDGVTGQEPGGKLLASLLKNVFPTEAKAADETWAIQTIENFRRDTLANGVIGGATYVTVHARAAELALQMLPATWYIGLVLMNQNCPEYLRTDEAALDADITRLASQHGRRLIVTDRFAVAVDSPLRRRAAQLAHRLGLRMQTHLNEQIAEKNTIEQTLYPGKTYTQVYADDGLLTSGAIMAHCIWMADDEWKLLRDAGAVVAHCPTSNTLLGSGIMNLDKLKSHGIDYALCTDVGASPTTSLLSEMAEFLAVHQNRAKSAAPSEALFRTTLAPARMLGLDNKYGSFAPGKSLTCAIITTPKPPRPDATPDDIIAHHILNSQTSPANPSDYQRLSQGNLTNGPELDRLTQTINARVHEFENKIRTVIIDGTIVSGSL